MTADRYGAAEPNTGSTPVLQVFPVTIGHYRDEGWPDLDTETEAGRVADLLAVFGGRMDRWAAPALERGADAAQLRLREWADSAGLPGATTSNGVRAGFGSPSTLTVTCASPRTTMGRMVNRCGHIGVMTRAST